MGGQLAQSVRAAYPNIEYYCVDLSTQLYVAGQVRNPTCPALNHSLESFFVRQVLRATFPGYVKGYPALKGLNTIQAERPGEILMVPNWLIGR